MALHPGIKFNIACDSFRDALDLLLKEKDYVAFMHGDFEFDGFKLLLRQDSVCIISRNYLNIKELPKLTCIMHKMSSGAKKHDEQWWNENFNEPPSIGVLTKKSQTCIEMVKQGLGYAILPLSHIERTQNLDSLQVMPLMHADGTPLLYDFSFFCSKETAKLTIVKKFVKFLKQHYEIEDRH